MTEKEVKMMLSGDMIFIHKIKELKKEIKELKAELATAQEEARDRYREEV